MTRTARFASTSKGKQTPHPATHSMPRRANTSPAPSAEHQLESECAMGPPSPLLMSSVDSLTVPVATLAKVVLSPQDNLACTSLQILPFLRARPAAPLAALLPLPLPRPTATPVPAPTSLSPGTRSGPAPPAELLPPALKTTKVFLAQTTATGATPYYPVQQWTTTITKRAAKSMAAPLINP